MLSLSDTDACKTWLSQFKVDDQAKAIKLIDSMLLVSQDEFIDRMRNIILKRAEVSQTPIGLYAEREIKKWRGEPNRLFKEKAKKNVKRALGAGPRPVESVRHYAPETGSEGIIAWLITELCREYPDKFINHPGPDRIRSKRVREIFIITDFIGSGKRVFDYLQAAWRIASVKSWHSYQLTKFEVLAYSGTGAGIKVVEKHKCQPKTDLVVSCPTIYTEFSYELELELRKLCQHYDPVDHDDTDSLGYKGTGALIVFSHSCPNNVPRMVHKVGKRWKPLFPSRVTAKVRAVFGNRDDASELFKRLESLGEKRVSSETWIRKTSMEGKKMLLLLSALRRAPRFDEALSRKTRLIIPEIRLLVVKAKNWGLIDEKRKLTTEGHYQLKHVRSCKAQNKILTSDSNQMYYPKSLRVPYNASS